MDLDRSAIGIIPARGGSKRIPRKNIRPFHGVPLLRRAIATMRDSGVFDRIVVSTDDPEIAGLATSSGAEVPFLRPTELADDTTGTGAVIRHAITELEAALEANEVIGDTCLMYPTAVFVSPSDLRASLEQLRRSTIDYVFAATPYSAPIERAVVRGGTGRCSMRWPEHLLTRSQDLPTSFHDVGQFYWGRRDAWAAGVPVLTGASEIYEMPSWRVQDIDTPDDWRRAELLFEQLAAVPESDDPQG